MKSLEWRSLGLTFIQPEPVLFCETGLEKLPGNRGKQGPRLLLESACLSELMYMFKHMCHLCLFHAFQGHPSMAATRAVGTQRSHSYGAISRSWVCNAEGKHSGSCTAKHAHRGTSVTSIADRTTIISYSLEHCWSPSATGALHAQTHMVPSPIKIRTCKRCHQKMSLLQL